MKRLSAAVTLAFAIAVVSACETGNPRLTADQVVAQGGRPVIGEALRALHSGMTHYGVFAGTDGRWTEYHAPDGYVVYRDRGRPITGTWTASEDQVCYQYDVHQDDFLNCHYYFQQGDRYYVVNASGDAVGITSGIVEIVRTGDSEELDDR